jgi:8-oxo-dGTP diphosphatase
MQIEHDYGDKQVLLDVHRVTAFSPRSAAALRGPAHALGADAAPALSDYPLPAANKPIVAALQDSILKPIQP